MAAQWGQVTAGEITTPIRGKLIAGDPTTAFEGLSTDSRQMRPGFLFVAIQGEHFDGHQFVDRAVAEGAAGIVIRKGVQPSFSQPNSPAVITVDDTLTALGDLAGWWRRQYRAQIAAITGSVGKTTTKEMAAAILARSTKTLKNEGNFNNLIGLPLTLFFLEDDHRRAVLEMGMNRPGEIGRLTEIADPDVGLITNVARAHLEGLADLDGVAKAKVELVDQISPQATVLLNGDDDVLIKAASRFQKRVVTFGLGPRNEIRAHRVRGMGRDGVSLEIEYRGESTTVRLRVPGLQHVKNAVAAAAIALSLDIPWDQIAEGLERYAGVKGRFMLEALPCGATVIDDTYNSNPTSLRAALDSVKALKGETGRVIVGLGEMLELGAETVPAHREAGSMVAEIGANVFLALGEHAGEMLEGAVEAGLPADRVTIVTSHEEMTHRIREEMRSGDLILLKGSRRIGLERVIEGLQK
jgi:UDP-N-acetylmuramoyl-tripeptide--D-alanyl-D-alanine ligase